ncbi:ABC transporter substrate-binding protein [Psychromonas sp. KJ10-10]|uniref:ABC transporter substrate-binding protein n=1 Tax=Psychromonas sp. KJ10-10 TaxID=3391823 RepID=UPI0039B4BDCB
MDYHIFSPADYEFDMYSGFLYTSEELIANEIQTVKAFREASLKGWQYTFSNINEAVNILFDKYNEQDLTKEEILFEALALKKLAYLNTTEIGAIDENKLKKSFEVYKVLGQGQGKIDYKTLVYDEKTHQTFLMKQKKIT